MKSFATGVFAIALLTVPLPVMSQSFDAMTPTNPRMAAMPDRATDAAAIASLVESVATLADQGNFEALERLFADSVQVDYTSLFGGEVQTHTPQSLMTAWASVLPGFDQTYHQITNVQVVVDAGSGDRPTATATADVTADHYLGASFWQVTGQYTYQLAQEGDTWKIAGMTFTLLAEAGQRSLLAAAAEAAIANPASYLQRQQTEQAVRDFLTSLEDKDMEAFAAVWAEDAVQDMPYAPAGFPRRVAGRDNLIQHYSGWPTVSGAANFTDELVFYRMTDPTMVFAEWHGVVEVIPTGRIYDQRYGGLFRVVDGKIVLFREYFNPIVFAEAFGLNEGGEFGNQ